MYCLSAGIYVNCLYLSLIFDLVFYLLKTKGNKITLTFEICNIEKINDGEIVRNDLQRIFGHNIKAHYYHIIVYLTLTLDPYIKV